MSHLAPTLSDLIFSSQANHNFSQTLSQLKRHTLSIQNHLTSILTDTTFIQAVSAHYNLPLIANERCGSWYIPPSLKHSSAYFKSTDGHKSEWRFNTRRLNLHLLKVIGESGGVVLVDSTRRGKRMPDALSKTVPIWCCVMNRALWPKNMEWHALYVPGNVVSELEKVQIEARLDGFVHDFLELEIDLEVLKKQIKKPMRPLWLTPQSVLEEASTSVSGWASIVCCTASRLVKGGEVSEGGYIQGAGDDTENWACGLTPSIFWTNKDLLMAKGEEELPACIKELLEQEGKEKMAAGGDKILLKPTDNLFVSILGGPQEKVGAIHVNLLSKVTPMADWQVSPTRLDVGVGSGKVGSRNLRTALPSIVSFIRGILLQRQPDYPSIMISCVDRKDLSIGLALVLICMLYDDAGKLLDRETQREGIDKLYIRRRLGWITESVVDANPSRSTLQSVNSFLM